MKSYRVLACKNFFGRTNFYSFLKREYRLGNNKCTKKSGKVKCFLYSGFSPVVMSLKIQLDPCNIVNINKMIIIVTIIIVFILIDHRIHFIKE